MRGLNRRVLTVLLAFSTYVMYSLRKGEPDRPHLLLRLPRHGLGEPVGWRRGPREERWLDFSCLGAWTATLSRLPFLPLQPLLNARGTLNKSFDTRQKQYAIQGLPLQEICDEILGRLSKISRRIPRSI